MKIIQNFNPVPTIKTIVVFDPWPFEAREVPVVNSLFWSGCDLSDQEESATRYFYLAPNDCVLIELTDGAYVICDPGSVDSFIADGLNEYLTYLSTKRLGLQR